MGAKKSYKRRHRRTLKQVLKFGKSAKASHKLKAGRTGGVHTRKLRSRRKGKRVKAGAMGARFSDGL